MRWLWQNLCQSSRYHRNLTPNQSAQRHMAGNLWG
nr:MAG TPA: hypothetical protein [Caudoviricetes sp.]